VAPVERAATEIVDGEDGNRRLRLISICQNEQPNAYLTSEQAAPS
jgi:hypothetical protein